MQGGLVFGFDLLFLVQNLHCTPEIDVGVHQVSDALMIAVVVVVFEEAPDLALEIIGPKVMLQQNRVRHELVPPFDLAWDLSRFGAAPCARLSYLLFEIDSAFPAAC